MANVPMLEYPSPSSSSPSNSFASESQCSGGIEEEEEEEGTGEGKEERCKAVDGQEGVFMTQVCTDAVLGFSLVPVAYSTNAGLGTRLFLLTVLLEQKTVVSCSLVPGPIRLE